MEIKSVESTVDTKWISNQVRIRSIDFMRGLVIVIMAIDHTRDLLHTTSLSQDPLDLNVTTPMLFMTRWMTHFCAPVFVFLAGTSSFLTLLQQNDLSKTKRFLRSRGLWLMVLELTIINFGVWFDIYFRTTLLQVIFVIGAGFFILSFLIKVPSKTLGIVGLSIIVLHNLIAGLKFETNQALEFTRTILVDQGFFKVGTDRAILIVYPVIPWLGILLFGFGFGKVFTLSDNERKKSLLGAGAIALMVFVTLRLFNLYGDPHHWSTQTNNLNSVLSFVDVTKYPPSLLYTAMTLSVMFFVLRLADGGNGVFFNFFVTYGRVPLFFYILHWYIIHLSMFVMLRIQGVTLADMPFGVMNFGRPVSGVGLELPYIYMYWISLVLFMYPACRWYGRFKAANKQITWLKYI